MSYNDYEVSTQNGRPVALYSFKWGKTYWRYTSADRAVTITEFVDGEFKPVTYEPQPISDNGMRQGASSQNDMEVSAPAYLPVVTLYRDTPPSESIWLTVRRKHADDDEAPIYWKGLVFNVKRRGIAGASVIGKPLSATLNRTGLRLCWSRECPHFVYDEGCGVDPADFQVNASVASASGVTITLAEPSGLALQYFRGGYVEWDANADGTQERRFIESQVGLELTVFGLTNELVAGQAVRLYPGCNRTTADCVEKFDNGRRFGGIEFLPTKSPFDAPIW